LFYGGMTAYAWHDNLTLESVRAIVGLTQSSFAEGTIGDVVSSVRGCLVGEHAWQVEDIDKDTPDQEAFGLTVERVDVTSQAAGTAFDCFLDENGELIRARKPGHEKERGIVSVGMNTLELLVIRNGAPVERFLTSESGGHIERRWGNAFALPPRSSSAAARSCSATR
jgi:hypothetical protein